MPLLNTIIASSAVAIGLLSQAAMPVNALAAPANALGARHASPGFSPNHHGVLKRKRNAHKHRKRCVAQNNGIVPSSSGAPAPAPSDGGNTNNNNNNNNNNPAPSPPPPPPAPGPVCSGGKVGLAWAPDVPSNWMQHVKTYKTCYYYNWSSWPANPDVTAGLNFIPMYWGPSWEKDQEFRSNVIDSPNWYGYALAMNEVNQAGQSQMDPYYGASLWRQHLLPLRWNRQYKLISPSTTSAPDGIPWLQTWRGLLSPEEQPDIMAIHWYGKSLQDFKNYMNSFHDAFPDKPVWITEFACTGFDWTGCNDDINYFANEAAAWLDQQWWIGAYFPFGFVGNLHGVHESNRAINPSEGWVTSVGRAYIGGQ